jgi:hypothetical protein
MDSHYVPASVPVGAITKYPGAHPWRVRGIPLTSWDGFHPRDSATFWSTYNVWWSNLHVCVVVAGCSASTLSGVSETKCLCNEGRSDDARGVVARDAETKSVLGRSILRLGYVIWSQFPD